MKTEFDYYYGAEAEQFSFVKIPKVLFSDKKHFGKLSIGAKMMYGLLLDRMSLSRRNNWFDNQNRVYIVFPIQLLALPNGWANAKDTAVTIMFNMSPFSYGCTDEDRIDIFTEKTEDSESSETEQSNSESENVPVEHLDTETEMQSETEISSDVPVEHFEETVTEGVTE